MRWSFILLIVLCSGIFLSGVQSISTNLFHSFSTIINNLQPENFDVKKVGSEDDKYIVRLKSSDLTFVNFHSSSCSHCITHAPTWVEFAKAMKVSGASVAALDCDEFRDVCSALKVTGTPAIKVFLKHELVKENVGENLEDLFRVASRDFRLPLVIQGKKALEAEAKIKGANVKKLEKSTKSESSTTKAATLGITTTTTTAAASMKGTKSKGGMTTSTPTSSTSTLRKPKTLDNSRPPSTRPTSKSTTQVTISKKTSTDNQNKQTKSEMLPTNPPSQSNGITALQPKLRILNDAALAIRYGLEKGVFMGKFVLDKEDLTALLRWLDLLRRAFPTAAGRWQLEWLYKQVKDVSARAPLSSKVFDEILLGWGFARRFHEGYEWKYCAPTSSKAEAGSGYTCGLWLLFHILSVSVAVNPTLKDIEISPAIHGFIDHFFSCTECRENFLKHNPKPYMPDKSSGDSFAFALWLWREHNHVTNRLNHEEAEAGLMIRAPRELFPPLETCNTCRRDLSTTSENPNFDEGVVVRYLEHAYSGFPETEELSFAKETEGSTLSPSMLVPSYSIMLVATFIGFIALSIAWLLRKKLKKKLKKATH